MTRLTTSSTFLLSLIVVCSFLSINASPTQSYERAVTVTNTSKAGLAWPNGRTVDITQFTHTGKVSWYYTWSPDPVARTDLEFVPMLWGSNQADEFNSTIDGLISDLGITSVLGMNEPQQPGQSNLTPEQGVDLWKTYIEPLKSRGLRLGSPAPSSADSGKTWLQDFLNICNGTCTVDFIALHWYYIDADNFINYVEDFHETFQRPIWVTEWDCQNFANANQQCSYNDIVSFLNTTQSWMDETDYVERYSWFGAMRNLQGVNKDNGLMDSKGEINNLGGQYIGDPNPQPGGRNAALSLNPSLWFLPATFVATAIAGLWC
ncbi:glycoside hydrolase [Dendrothele bispora CBS 962.96]|uniref:Glycoside hydrolase n=1 Tax=Dendrothele bispora (strain CBS 962.96) TaxID=1314807 RepID=A0A4V4HD32_DENBC|nr:glycoside hydrolase [Dendrothele bispora CBS 962.96]